MFFLTSQNTEALTVNISGGQIAYNDYWLSWLTHPYSISSIRIHHYFYNLSYPLIIPQIIIYQLSYNYYESIKNDSHATSSLQVGLIRNLIKYKSLITTTNNILIIFQINQFLSSSIGTLNQRLKTNFDHHMKIVINSALSLTKSTGQSK
jgi:hypothetical protein